MTEDVAAAKHMRRALELARLGWGSVHPNPMVGAVVVRDGQVVGEGYHQRYGEAHAEVMALRAAGERARGATLYVTLEPCNHHGKTPPCTDAIIGAGVTKVVFATNDPHTTAAGGAERLRSAGIAVSSGVEHEAARELNRAFFHVHERGAPYVVLKLAVSLDGGIAARVNERTIITGPEATQEVHRLRAGFDAILVGRGTADIDDPLLTVRGQTVRKPPVRIVIDSTARLDPASRLVQTTADAPLWVVTTPHADPARSDTLQAHGVRILTVTAGRDGVDLRSVLHELVAQGVTTIFAEGGSRIARALIGDDLVERIILFMAPTILGPDAVPAFAQPLSSRWQLSAEQPFGEDVAYTYDRVPRD
jgi:diaminohydroxyphosphoribosylaminopyrimidine deaminase / 5-amino-6-(5-phosphoribosylamino)uracil reductase